MKEVILKTGEKVLIVEGNISADGISKLYVEVIITAVYPKKLLDISPKEFARMKRELKKKALEELKELGYVISDKPYIEVNISSPSNNRK